MGWVAVNEQALMQEAGKLLTGYSTLKDQMPYRSDLSFAVFEAFNQLGIHMDTVNQGYKNGSGAMLTQLNNYNRLFARTFYEDPAVDVALYDRIYVYAGKSAGIPRMTAQQVLCDFVSAIGLFQQKVDGFANEPRVRTAINGFVDMTRSAIVASTQGNFVVPRYPSLTIVS